MNPRHAVTLACAYFLGWAFVLAALILVANYAKEPAFLAIEQHENDFLWAVGTAWLCFSVPCFLVVLGLNRELRAKVALFLEMEKPKASDSHHPTK